MGWAQIITMTALAGGLFGVAGITFWWQLRHLRQLSQSHLPDEEIRYLRHQGWRRLVTSSLLLILAVLLVGAMAFLESPAQQLADESDAAKEQGKDFVLADEQRTFARVYGWYWIVFLLILFLVVLLAGLDLWSVRRYGLKQHRRLNEDRRDMLQRQLQRLRQERNERN